jgi:hypothetical protein
MPLEWKLTIGLQALCFAVATRSAVHSGCLWLAVYFAACVTSSAVWLTQSWNLAIGMRPALLTFQAAAILQAVSGMHEECMEASRRIRLGACCAAVAVAGTVTAAEYPDFPLALFWAQLWLNVAGFIGCSTLVIAFAWWPSFEPEPRHVINVWFLAAYCGLQAGALTYAGRDRSTWIQADEFATALRCAILSCWTFALWMESR